ncbi:MAG: DUF2098 domain-containing protein [Burkholderiaceae bacterium]|nr:DUF2098 domain-containing protein [Burkholderiaceae bacterium]
MTRPFLPRLGDLVRDRRTGTVGRVTAIYADSGHGTGWLFDIAPHVSRADALRGAAAPRIVRASYADIEAVH